MSSQPDPKVTIAARVDARLRICRLAVEAVVAAHEAFTRRATQQLTPDSQATAFWELSGRCVSLSSAYLDLLALGYCAEATVLARALHEAVMLTNAVGDRENESLAVKWLAGKDVRAKEARNGVQRIHTRLAEAHGAEGLRDPPPGDVSALSGRLFGALSKGAHNTRSGFRESVAPGCAAFVYGPHPDLVTRAVAADYATSLIEHVVIVVGGCLSTIMPDLDLRASMVLPIQSQLEAECATHPLSRDEVVALIAQSG